MRPTSPPIGALTVLLDDLIDRDDDLEAGEHNYLSYFADNEQRRRTGSACSPAVPGPRPRSCAARADTEPSSPASPAST